jgi:hypothetical protein
VTPTTAQMPTRTRMGTGNARVAIMPSTKVTPKPAATPRIPPFSSLARRLDSCPLSDAACSGFTKTLIQRFLPSLLPSSLETSETPASRGETLVVVDGSLPSNFCQKGERRVQGVTTTYYVPFFVITTL